MLLILSLKTYAFLLCIAEVFQNEEIMGCVKSCFCFAKVRETNIHIQVMFYALPHSVAKEASTDLA